MTCGLFYTNEKHIGHLCTTCKHNPQITTNPNAKFGDCLLFDTCYGTGEVEPICCWGNDNVKYIERTI